MLELRRVEKLALCLQILQYLRIRFFHKDTGIRRLLGQFTFSVYKLHERQVIFSADIRIILTECRSDVNDSGTV